MRRVDFEICGKKEQEEQLSNSIRTVMILNLIMIDFDFDFDFNSIQFNSIQLDMREYDVLR